MKHLLLLGLLLLCGCSTVMKPASTEPPEDRIVRKYADVAVSRLLRVIDGDTFACSERESIFFAVFQSDLISSAAKVFLFGDFLAAYR